jgi:hypothetical protein
MVTWVAAGKLAFYNYINMVGQTTTFELYEFELFRRITECDSGFYMDDDSLCRRDETNNNGEGI